MVRQLRLANTTEGATTVGIESAFNSRSAAVASASIAGFAESSSARREVVQVH